MVAQLKQRIRVSRASDFQHSTAALHISMVSTLMDRKTLVCTPSVLKSSPIMSGEANRALWWIALSHRVRSHRQRLKMFWAGVDLIRVGSERADLVDSHHVLLFDKKCRFRSPMAHRMNIWSCTGSIRTPPPLPSNSISYLLAAGRPQASESIASSVGEPSSGMGAMPTARERHQQFAKDARDSVGRKVDPTEFWVFLLIYVFFSFFFVDFVWLILDVHMYWTEQAIFACSQVLVVVACMS
jgi:hypothetical protein